MEVPNPVEVFCMFILELQVPGIFPVTVNAPASRREVYQQESRTEMGVLQLLDLRQAGRRAY